jgi:ankyrin repeat protein
LATAYLAVRLWRADALGPLCRAAEKGDVGTVDGLLKGGADVNAPSGFNGWTALHAAAAAGRPEVVRLLLDRGARVNQGDERGYTALHNTADDFTKGGPSADTEAGRNASAAVLLDHGANANLRTSAGMTPLHLATETNNAALVKLLLERGADPNPTTRDQAWTPLHLTTFPSPDRSEIARLLLEHGGDPTLRDAGGRTALDYADERHLGIATLIRARDR